MEESPTGVQILKVGLSIPSTAASFISLPMVITANGRYGFTVGIGRLGVPLFTTGRRLGINRHTFTYIRNSLPVSGSPPAGGDFFLIKQRGVLHEKNS